MVGIRWPCLAVAFHQRLGHVDAEVVGQVGKGSVAQCRHAVGIEEDIPKASAVLEGLIVHIAKRVGQDDTLQFVASGQRLAQMADGCEVAQLVERLYVAAPEDAVDIGQL